MCSTALEELDCGPEPRIEQDKCTSYCALLARTPRIFPEPEGPCGTSCRLGPTVLRRRQTFDRRIERCAPAVPQHDRARTSAIPLPAHRPCAAASQQSPAAIVPHGDVGCLAGFRQEGRHFWSMFDRSVPNGEASSAPFSQTYTPFGRSRRLDGKGAS